MPKPEIISSKLGELPIFGEECHRLNKKDPAKKNKLWEANEQGGHFQIFKFEVRRMAYTPAEYVVDRYKLTISGTSRSRVRIAADFKKVLGEPVSVRESGNKRTIETIVWEKGPKRPRWGQRNKV